MQFIYWFLSIYQKAYLFQVTKLRKHPYESRMCKTDYVRTPKCGTNKSTTGHPKPELAREPETISLLDIYKAVEGDKPLLHLDTHTNPECGIGVNIQLALQSFMIKCRKMRKILWRVSVLVISSGYYQRIEKSEQTGR